MKVDNSKLRIIPLGGMDAIGMNITAFEYDDEIIVVDCGLSFPTEDMLGIDLVIPDITYLKDNIDKVKGFFITHGHEDHIGALPYILRDVNVPVYGTRLTMGIIENKFLEFPDFVFDKKQVVSYGQTIELKHFKVEFIKTNHSIADAAALAIFTPVGTVFHTGDFKIDYTPLYGDSADLQRFAQLGKEGVLALLCDSTNALRPGVNVSEQMVAQTIERQFVENADHRIIVATFASNVDRVQHIINIAARHGRKVVLEGRSMVNIINTASEMGYLQLPENTMIPIDQLRNYPDEKTVLITTGSQGEHMAALSRMAAGIHRKVTIMPGDVVVLSSNPIPGNEKAVYKVINDLAAKGAKIIHEDTHVSGHARQEEIKLMYTLLNPKYAIPVHGEFRHRQAQAGMAYSLGMDHDHVFMANAGDVIEMDQDSARIIGKVTSGTVMVDGLGVGDVGNIVLRDRQSLSKNGIMIIVLTLEKETATLLAGPDIVSRGFVYVRESEELMEAAHNVVYDAVESCLTRGIVDWSQLKSAIRDELGEFLWKQTKRSPMILPIIMEV